MIIKRSYLKFLGLFLIIGSIVFLVIGPLLPRLIDINTYQQQVVNLLEDALKRRISLSEIRFNWRFGPEFVVNDLHVRERQSSDEFLSARTVTIRLGMLPLLQRRLVFKQVTAEGLTARLVRDEDGRLNIADLLEPGKDGLDLQTRRIKIRQGTVTWLDQANDDGDLEARLSNLDLDLGNIGRGKKTSFKLTAALTNAATTGSIKASGTLKIPKAEDGLLRSLEANASIDLRQIDFCRFWPYYGHYLPFGRPGGLLDLETTFKGSLEKFNAKGYVKLHHGSVTWPTVFHGPVAPKLAQVSFDLKRTPNSVELPSFQLFADGFTLRGSGKLTDLQTADPYLSVKGVTDPFEYKNIHSYVPYGIIEKDTSDFIEHKIKAGTFKLDTGTLEGRFSKLAKFTEGDNANALFIYGTAQQAVVSYGPQMPSFNNVKGILELKGRNFNLHKMSGSFGGSPFTLQGSITEYSTMNLPSEYPFQMEITPRPAEVAWLAKLAGAEKLNFGGNSTLRLIGEGPIKAFRLSGDWQLSQAHYQFPDAVRKPSGMLNSLSFSSVLSKREARLTSLSYSLPPLQLSALATFRHGDNPPSLSFEVQTNSFALGPQVPIMTGWQQYQPKGLIQAHLFGNGDPRDFSAMLYSGSIRLNAFSVKPLEQFAPVNAINGIVSFKGNSLETSNIAVRYGSTPLTIRGRIASLQNPEAELFITSPDLKPSDFGLSHEAKNVRRFSANLGLRKGLLTVRNLSGQLEKSTLSAAGTIRPEAEPEFNLRVAATYLDIDELMPFFAPKQQPDAKPTAQTPGAAKPTTAFKLKANVAAEAGNYRDLQFSKLSSTLSNEGGLLRLQTLDANLLGGSLSANGQLERISGQPTKWALALLLNRVKSDEVFHSLGISREISGLMTIKGNLRAQGGSLDELKRTATGNLDLKIERGVLRRFNSLSKVFSLLNVSQLLTFKLPDMNTQGMPFNQITATVGVKDGVISGQDFFIESNAMHISMVGKIDIVKENLDLLIGVQPLQTVDKVISRIPVVGWILTGGDGSLITTYFEAKGSWADPQVTAIPVKSMASGTLDIFRRVFELPVRLFTDSGEVILGNQKERPKAKQE